MAGYSQSGVDTAGFAIGLAKHYGTPAGKPVFDGYFPAAQAASATPLKAGTSVLPKFEYPVWTAVGVPVVNLEDQSGIMGFTAELPADAQATLGQKEYVNVSSATTRRADSDKKGDQYRLYEVAGMPHAPGGDGGCEGPPSTFPVAAVARGTFALLNRWVETGQKPPRAPSCQDGRDRHQNSKVVGRRRTATPSAASGRRTSTTRSSATTRRRPARSPAGSRATRRALDSARAGEGVPERRRVHEAVHEGPRRDDQGRVHRPGRQAQLIADQKEKATQVLGQ